MHQHQAISHSGHRKLTRLLNPRQATGRLFVLATLLFLLLGLRATPVSAATLTVCASGCDHVTIAAAITAAAAGDTLSLSAETFTEGDLTIDKDLTITGASADTTIVQAAATAGTATTRVFDVLAGATVTIEKMTIRHGNPTGTYDNGGGIRNVGTLTINDTIISDNVAGPNNSRGGGGIDNFNGFPGFEGMATLTINNSIIRDNSHNRANGGGGGVRSNQRLTINNSTFTGNTVAGSNALGGAIRIDPTTAASIAEINNSTFSGNSAPFGGGVASQGTLTIRNSTVTGNTSDGTIIGDLGNYNGVMHVINTIAANNQGAGNACTSNVDLATETNNLIEGAHSCGTPVSTADPMLGGLADNGGDTQTHALLMNSPAIDAGDNTACAAAEINNLDQRGAARAGGAGSGGSTCDIGAYEYDSPPLAVTLASLQAVATGEHVVVTWQTVSERNNLGFNLYRSSNADGPSEQLNSGLIPAQAPGSGQGAGYEWLDTTVEAGSTYFYWLEDVDVDGNTTMHGPISAVPNETTAVTTTQLSSQSRSDVPAFALLALMLLIGGWLLRRRQR